MRKLISLHPTLDDKNCYWTNEMLDHRKIGVQLMIIYLSMNFLD